MPQRGVEELKQRIRALLRLWHPGTRPGNDGEPGNTLEDLLGIDENNLKLPDFGEVEIKADKHEGGSLLTLFHREPAPRASVPRLLKCLGWRHTEAGVRYPDDEMSFRSTTYGDQHSVRGFTIECSEDRINFLFDPAKVDRNQVDKTGAYKTYGDWLAAIETRDPHYGNVLPVYYPFQDVITVCKSKLEHTLLVVYKSKGARGAREYWYEEAFLMKGFRQERIQALVRDGSLVLDFDARTRHNHGTKFRIKRNRARELFTFFTEIT